MPFLVETKAPPHVLHHLKIKIQRNVREGKYKGGKITLLMCIEKGTNIHSLLRATPSNKDVTKTPMCSFNHVTHVQKPFTPDVSLRLKKKVQNNTNTVKVIVLNSCKLKIDAAIDKKNPDPADL